jgi:hypothetical protein
VFIVMELKMSKQVVHLMLATKLKTSTSKTI